MRSPRDLMDIAEGQFTPAQVYQHIFLKKYIVHTYLDDGITWYKPLVWCEQYEEFESYGDGPFEGLDCAISSICVNDGEDPRAYLAFLGMLD